MLTPEEIQAASATLTDETRAVLVTLVRQFRGYSPVWFPNLESTIDAATEIQRKQLNALTEKLNAVGAGSVKLSGGKRAVNYDQTRDRDELLRAVLAVLYDAPVVESFVRLDSEVGDAQAWDFFAQTYRELS